MIYLAQPYTHKTYATVTGRFRLGEFMTFHYLNLGEIVFSPIVHGHKLSINYNLPTDFDWWMNYNKALIDRSDELRILCLPGWDKSIGVTAEIKHANKMHLKISYVMWDTIKTLADAHKDEINEEFPLRYWTTWLETKTKS